MNQQLIRKVKEMQKEMEQTQKAIEETVFRGFVAGVVSVELYGTKEIKAINIDPSFEVTDTDDLEVLNDSIIASCRVAYDQIEKTTKEKMSKYTAMLGGGLF